MSASIQAADTRFLWYLGMPSAPLPVGELRLLVQSRGVSLRYADSWLKQGFPLSEDLPLIDIEHLPSERQTAAGAVDDARPDRWGERVIRLLDRPPRLALLDYLFLAGDDRFGALGVSSSATAYLPHPRGALPTLADIDQLHALTQQILNGEAVDERFRRLIAPGATMGGARPKALIDIEGEQWVLKFAEESFSFEPWVEHATMTLAAQAGITVADTRPIQLARGTAVAVRRFDRQGTTRLHALSANVALRAAGAELTYPDLAQLLRRRGGKHREQMRELFRRLVFNILVDNTDDHEKNHALLMTDAQHYVLSPAFDVLPTGQALGYQSMGVGEDGASSTLDNAMSLCKAYGLTTVQAKAEMARVARVVDGWQPHFVAAGIPPAVIATYAAQIDRPFLLDPRRQALQHP
jgi:serine/threonine-protein kinase HipA